VASNATATANTVFLRPNTRDMVASYLFSRKEIRREEIVFFSGSEGLMKRDAITGTYVKQKIMAPINAKQNTRAIGRNILPSTPTRERMGMKTMIIMSCPN